MAEDGQDNGQTPVAPAEQATQPAQGAAPAPAASSPAPQPAEKEDLILGKFKSAEDLAKSYQELESAYGREKQKNQAPQQQPAPVPPQVPPMTNDLPFDNETLTGLDSWYQKRRESERASEFVRNHQQELADPILAGTTQRIIAEANARGERIDQEAALAQAKDLLNQRLEGKANEAKGEGFQEGKEIARKKELSGAVGDTNSANPKPDPDTMSAKDFAKYYNLPRV